MFTRHGNIEHSRVCHGVSSWKAVEHKRLHEIIGPAERVGIRTHFPRRGGGVRSIVVDQGVLLLTIAKSRRDTCRQRYSALEASDIVLDVLVAVDLATLAAHPPNVTVSTFPHSFAATTPFGNDGTWQVQTFTNVWNILLSLLLCFWRGRANSGAWT